MPTATEPYTILNDPESIDWLFQATIDRETRYMVGSPKLYGCAVVWGDPSEPDRIMLYHSNHPTAADDCVTLTREDGDDWTIWFRWSRIDGVDGSVRYRQGI